MWDFNASGNIICMGSIIMDISVKCRQFPETGETIYTSYPYEVTPGGKGANQAIAAARLGGKVRMLGRIADDAYGHELKENLSQAGIDTDMLVEDKNAGSGVAFVWVNESGDNQIICSPGVNLRNTAEDVKSGLEISTAAGDTFIGALASCLAAGKPIAKAVEYGNKAAAKCVQRMGAQVSIPYARDI